jgi:hypothetical protein
MPIPWVRYVMDTSTSELVNRLETAEVEVLEISGNAWKDKANWKTYTAVEYPEFDVCTDKILQNYDLIIAEQVFEHLRYPWRAAINIYGGLRRGGYCLLTTPFLFHIHPTPLDCWRWTPQGMGFLLEDAGFQREHILTQGWGNLECLITHIVDVSNAPGYDGSQPLHSTPHLPIVVWGFARKGKALFE